MLNLSTSRRPRVEVMTCSSTRHYLESRIAKLAETVQPLIRKEGSLLLEKK
jgi:hypothetical protein